MSIKIEPQAPLPSPPPETSRALVPYREPPTPVITGPLVEHEATPDAIQATGKSIRTADVRHVSPRQMTTISMDLYVNGIIGWDEYAMLAFQPELHPDFDKTIGALTGEKAQPDRPRDFIETWEKHLSYKRKYNPGDARQIRQVEHLVNVLRQLGSPISMLV
ncbi:MAG: hypothetical protein HOL37_07400 [Rhodospirillaceae bacterium]|jgi:hypothetical protein|nr:hypothetical protein [Rhodospirillaceae bacterium]MBT4220108.1 hypothetical protein [Rhodospirillaceae bacterium]MBT4464666.1 hypothetical protein [Rhodospirillaceae bacterium]MBT5014422.1 hypothetical protein [Rhodospirillaceae bacterium]MBT5309142.1 hypothetical protein [Rhodospirillaceae bacterium]